MKCEIKEVIYKHLVKNGVLSEVCEASVAEQVPVFVGEGEELSKPEEMASMDPADLPSPTDPRLVITMQTRGKAQEVCSALTLDQSLDYNVMKNAVLHAYELVPEAYWQKFRNLVKTPNQTFVEFAREKANLFDKWCAVNKVNTFDLLKELILLEECKNCLTEKIVVYFNEQKLSSLTEAAVFSDEFVLTHRVVFSPVKRNIANRVSTFKVAAVVKRKMINVDSKESRECFYCHEVGHLIANCPTLKRKSSRKENSSKSVALIERSDLEIVQNESISLLI